MENERSGTERGPRWLIERAPAHFLLAEDERVDAR